MARLRGSSVSEHCQSMQACGACQSTCVDGLQGLDGLPLVTIEEHACSHMEWSSRVEEWDVGVCPTCVLVRLLFLWRTTGA